MICVYDYTKECFDGNENIYLIDKPSVLANPYTEMWCAGMNKRYLCSSHEESVERYEHYFGLMYGANRKFTKAINELYDIYRSGKNLYLACTNRGERGHGDVIKERLQQMLLKEKMSEKKTENRT